MCILSICASFDGFREHAPLLAPRRKSGTLIADPVYLLLFVSPILCPLPSIAGQTAISVLAEAKENKMLSYRELFLLHEPTTLGRVRTCTSPYRRRTRLQLYPCFCLICPGLYPYVDFFLTT